MKLFTFLRIISLQHVRYLSCAILSLGLSGSIAAAAPPIEKKSAENSAHPSMHRTTLELKKNSVAAKASNNTFWPFDAGANVWSCPESISIGISPATYCTNTQGVLSVNVIGGTFTNPTYQWSASNGRVTITGATSATPDIDYIASGTSIIYVTVTDDNGSCGTGQVAFTASQTISISATPEPSISISTTEVCQGNTINNVTGSPSGSTRQWTVNNFSVGNPFGTFSAPTNQSTNFTANHPGDAEIRYEVTTTAGCTGTSEAQPITIFNPVVATAAIQSSNQPNVCADATLTLAASATGGNGSYSYVWEYMGGTQVVPTFVNASILLNNVNAQNPVLTPVGTASDGDTYVFRVKATDGILCEDFSDNITITVRSITSAALSITGASTICEDGTTTFKVDVTRGNTGGSPTYTLVYNDGTADITVNNYVSGSSITTNAQSADCSLSIVSIKDARVTVSNCSSPDNGSPSSVTVNNLTAGAVSADQTICSGDDVAAFTVGTAATGDGTLSYQWQISTDGGASWNDIDGATGTTYDEGTLTADAQYRRITTSMLNSVACTATSNVITVTVNNLTAGTVGADQTICSGDDVAAFTVGTAATGDGTLSYQWQISTDGGAMWNDINAATAATYDEGTLTADAQYRRITTSTLNSVACTATSNVITVTVNNVTAGEVAGDQTICSTDDTAAFTEVTPSTGDGTLSYQWQISTDGGTVWNDINTATASTYDEGALTADAQYRRITTSTLNSVACTATSNAITVTVNNITAGTIAGDQTICSGQTASFTETNAAAPDGAISYEWESSIDNGANWSIIPSATSATYTTGALTQNTQFRRKDISSLNSVDCNAYTNVLTVTVQTATGGVWYVNDATGNDANLGTEICPKKTIGAAVTAATAGDIIIVAAGTYTENVLITKTIELRGANYGVDPNTDIRVAESIVSGTFLVQSSDVSIDGFAITGNSFAVQAPGTGQSEITISNNHMYANTGGRTIEYWGSAQAATNWYVLNNLIEDVQATDATAITLFNITGLSITDNVILHTNSNFNGRRGLNLDGCKAVNFSGNTVNMGLTNPASDNSDNAFTKARYSLQLSASATDRSVTDVSVYNNTLVGGYSGLITLGNGVYDDINISNNEMNNNVLGIRFQAGTNVPSGSQSNITIQGNNISTSSRGIYLQNGASGGGSPDPYTNISITNNSLLRNTDGSTLEVESDAILPDGPVSATCNWYGSQNANVIASKVTGNVTYSPWLVNGTDDQPSTLGFQPLPGVCTGTAVTITAATVGNIWCGETTGSIDVAFSGGDGPYDIAWTGGNATGVTSPYTISALAAGTYDITITDANGSTDTETGVQVQYLPVHNTTADTRHATIQAAIDAAVAGQVIEVCAGTYEENVTVSKALDVRGPNWNISPNGGTRVAEAIIVPASTNTSTGAIVTINSGDVSFIGFTLEGDNTDLPNSGVGLGGALGTSMDAARGIFLQANGITGVTIAKNIAKNAVNGIRLEQTTNYFATTSGALRSYNILVDDNKVQDMTGTGIRLGNSMYAKVTNNTVTNVSTGIAFSSFRISDAGNAADRVISNNTITSRFAGLWVNLFHASPYALNNNTISVASNAPEEAPTPLNRTAWFGIMYSTVSAPQNFTNQVSLPKVTTPEYWTATGNMIDGAELEGSSTGYGYWLYHVDNNRDDVSVDHFGQISGGTVSGVDVGMMLKNRDTDPATNFGTAAVGAHASVSDVDFSLRSGGTGLRLVDDASWTTSNPAPLINKRDVKLTIGNDVTFTGGATGIKIEHPVAGTSNYNAYSSITSGDLSNTTLSSQSGNYLELSNHPNALDATMVSFDGQTGATATLAENFDIEDKISHKTDDGTRGFVRVKATEVFVTPNSASVQRGVDAASENDVINVEGGSYSDNITINGKNGLVLRGPNNGLNDVNATRTAEAVITAASNAPLFTMESNVTSYTIDGFQLVGANYSEGSNGRIIWAKGQTTANNILNNRLELNSDLTGTKRYIWIGPAVSNNSGANYVSGSVRDNILEAFGTGTGFNGICVQQQSQNFTIAGNRFENMSGQRNILLWHPSATTVIEYNDLARSVTNTGDLIYLGGPGAQTNAGAVVRNNRFSNDGKGLVINGMNYSPVVTNNHFGDVTSLAIQLESPTSGTVDATCNWYGTANANNIPAKLSAGNINYVSYLVDGTDNNGTATGFEPMAGVCTGTPVEISSATKTADAICDADAKITVTFSGGTAPYDIAWTGGSATGVSSPYVITGLASGSYTATVTDANGSTAASAAVSISTFSVGNENTGVGYATIKAAHDAATAGDVIKICAGVYNEPGFALSKAITLKGAQGGVDARTRGASETGETVLSGTGRIFDLNTSGIILDGLYFRNLAHRGMDCYQNANGFTVRNCVINVTSTNSSGGAIQFGGGSNLTANNLVFEKNLVIGSSAGYALYILHSAADGLIQDNILNSRRFMFGPFGQAGGWQIKRNLFDGEIGGTAHVGYPINAQFGNAVVDRNTLRKLSAGMQISIVGGSITNNVFDDNNFYGFELFGGAWGSPVSSDVTIANNTFSFNGVGTNARGLRVGRTAGDPNQGFDPAPGIDGSTIHINDNSFTDLGFASGVKAAEFNGSNMLDAECNWWGTVNANTIASKLSAQTDYSAYRVDGTDTDGAAIGFQPALNTCTGTPVVISSATPTDAICGVEGSILVAFQDGQSPYNIAWTGGSSLGVTSPFNIGGLNAGTYDITVTDANGSTATAVATVQYLPVSNTSANTYHATIQAAIDAATEGDNIEICAGTYTAQAITVNKRLDINGQGDATIIQNNAAGSTVFTYTAAGSGTDAVNRAYLRNVKVSGSNRGLLASQLVNHLTLDDVTFDGNTSYAIHVNNTSGVMNDWEITNCTFNANSAALYVSTAANIDGVSITGSTFNNQTNTAIYAGQSSGTPGGFSNVTITGNTFTDNGPSNNQAAFYLEKLTNAVISENTMTNNGLSTNPRGIIVNLKYGAYSNVSITDNTIVENRGGLQTNGYGVNVQGRNDAPSYNSNPGSLDEVTVSGNEISGLYRGIEIDNDVNWNFTAIQNNTISGAEYGILGVIYGSGNTANTGTTMNVHENSILADSLVVVNFNPNGGEIDAECNWYGTINGSIIADKIVGTVDYSPWLVDGTDDDLMTIGFQPVSGACSATAVEVTLDMQTNITGCFGDATGAIEINISGGVPPYTYDWSNGATTQDLSGLIAGTYTVTVTDGLGTTGTLSATLTQPDAVTPSGTAYHVSCRGGNNGSIELMVTGGTGLGSYNFDWNGSPAGDDSSVITDLEAGTYTVTVTDANNCTGTTSVTVNEPASEVSADIIASTNVFCNGGSTGTATVTAAGGTPGYSYTWSNGQTDATAINLTAGTYTVTIMDDNDCEATADVTISEPAALMSSITAQTDVSCNGGSNGAATVTATGGTMPYSYDWAGTPAGDGTVTITGLNAASYTVTVTDNLGCSVTTVATITQPDALSLGTSQTNVTCNGENDGTATVTPDGGTTPYTYAWSNGQTDATAIGLIAGTYTVTVTDGNVCETNTSVTITQPGVLAIATSPASATATVACGTTVDVNNEFSTWNTGVTFTGGAAPITVAANYTVTTDVNGDLVETYNGTEPTAPSADGGYTVVTWTVTDDCGNTATVSATFTVNNCMRISGALKYYRDDAGVGGVNVDMVGIGANDGISAGDGSYTVYSNTTGNFDVIPASIRVCEPCTSGTTVSTANLKDIYNISVEDVDAIKAHIAAGAQFDNIYQRAAANVVLGSPGSQTNNRLTSADATALSQAINGSLTQQGRLSRRAVPHDEDLIAGAPDPLPRSWGLVPVANAGGQAPAQYGDFTQKRNYPTLDGAFIDQDFVVLQVGDVTDHNSLRGEDADARYAGLPLIWKLKDAELTEGEVINAEFRIEQMQNLRGWQFGLQFDPEYLKVDTLTTTNALPLDPEVDFGLYQAEMGEIRSLWTDGVTKSLNKGESVFTLRFTALQGGKNLSDVLKLEEGSATYALTDQRDHVAVLLAFDAQVQPNRSPVLYQNTPNPFNMETSVRFELPEASDIQLTIHDVNGRLIQELNGYYSEGLHEVRFGRGEMGQYSGVLYYTLRSGDFIATRKMVIID